MHGCSTLHPHAHLFNTSTVTRQGLLRAGERPLELLAQVQRTCGINDLYVGDLSYSARDRSLSHPR